MIYGAGLYQPAGQSWGRDPVSDDHPSGASPGQNARVRFGANLRRARQRARITQAELARRLGASQAYVSQVENGRENLTQERMAAIAEALGCTIDFLVCTTRRRTR
jgi:DNA-binding XRE family transcriptional regulator